MNKLAELSIKDFKAIKQADISLEGITVVSGVNGCGKSTMSKLLYYIFRNANTFEELVLLYTDKELRPYLNVLEQIQTTLLVHSETANLDNYWYFKDFALSSFEEASKFLDAVKDLCNRFLEREKMFQQRNESLLTDRLRMIFRATLNTNQSRDIKHVLDLLIGRISEYIAKAEQLNAERPYRLFEESLRGVLDSSSKKVNLKEYGDSIVGEGILNVPVLHYIKKVAYIDTPMVIGMETSYRQPVYWKELNELLKQPPRRGYKRTINNFIKEEIIKGDAVFEDDSFPRGFKYKRADGKEFDLLECATGIKSFSVLQLLLKNLFLDEHTLLIIDEPEAHLHPQWIVEYARLLVLLHKKIGVKFFIASHSTDMVSAIRYLAEKEKCLSSVSFYVAEEDAHKKDTYRFRSLGHDIEPIFESFNKSFERLDFYVDEKKE